MSIRLPCRCLNTWSQRPVSVVYDTVKLVINSSQRHLASRGRPDQEYTENEYAAARQWRSSFGPNSLPKDLSTTRFDRSSGKGGQHVNTYNLSFLDKG